MTRPATKWWDRLCDPQYRHVACYGWAADAGAWVLIDPAENVCFATAVSQAGLEVWLTANAGEITSIVNIKPVNRFEGWRRPFPWCTSIISHVIGLPGGALRPQALRRDLFRHGAVEIGGQDEGEG